MGINSSNLFLPTTPEEMRQRGWKQADIILVTADAYVDHPTFGVALIGRWLEKLVDAESRRIMLELIEDRHGVKSTLIIS